MSLIAPSSQELLPSPPDLLDNLNYLKDQSFKFSFALIPNTKLHPLLPALLENYFNIFKTINKIENAPNPASEAKVFSDTLTQLQSELLELFKKIIFEISSQHIQDYILLQEGERLLFEEPLNWSIVMEYYQKMIIIYTEHSGVKDKAQFEILAREMLGLITHFPAYAEVIADYLKMLEDLRAVEERIGEIGSSKAWEEAYTGKRYWSLFEELKTDFKAVCEHLSGKKINHQFFKSKLEELVAIFSETSSSIQRKLVLCQIRNKPLAGALGELKGLVEALRETEGRNTDRELFVQLGKIQNSLKAPENCAKLKVSGVRCDQREPEYRRGVYKGERSVLLELKAKLVEKLKRYSKDRDQLLALVEKVRKVSCLASERKKKDPDFSFPEFLEESGMSGMVKAYMECCSAKKKKFKIIKALTEKYGIIAGSVKSDESVKLERSLLEVLNDEGSEKEPCRNFYDGEKGVELGEEVK